MAKVRFYCNSGANIHSCNKSSVLDTQKDLGLDENEWDEMSENDKYKLVEEWAWSAGLEIYYEEE